MIHRAMMVMAVTSFLSSSTPSCYTSSHAFVMVATSNFSPVLHRHSLSTSAANAVQLVHSDFFVHTTTPVGGDHEAKTITSRSSFTKPPVIFLHGLLGNRRNFATIGRSLAQQLDRKRRIIGVDLRNHGDTASNIPHSMTYQEMALDVLAFLDREAIAEAVLVGHSMGGKVAQAVALLHPERVQGLVVLDIAPVTYCPQKDPHWKAVVDILHVLNNVPTSSNLDRKHVDTVLQQHIPDPALRAFLLTNWDVKTASWKIPIGALVDQLPHLATFVETTNQFHGDAFFIHGGQSRFVRHAYLNTIASFFPNHLLTTIKGAGHWVHAEAPEDTTALLKQFLDR